MTPMPELEELLTAGEVAKRLRVSQQSIRRWTETGVLPAIRVGPRVIRYRRADIDAIVAEYEHETGEAV